ncbi:FtsX-like permease family protein [Sphingomonas ginkgonis]|uniref:FtsX-like permease family protein n=1 Tax=Sphingomonas ginkgonis TaxID=2315330 RepID=A0A429V6I7_9SPHN|nr:FtsX-like permease family protein [Sphingomonas ginkgonis]RST29555.1 FtsX-like permease family protein [Sphingomonas ginkgonis]
MSAALRLARRDLAGGAGGLWLLFACLLLAVAGLASVTSLASAIGATIDGKSRDLLGGDLLLVTSQREATTEELAAMRRLGPVSGSATLRAMLRTARGDASLVELSGTDRPWPAAGSVSFVAGGMPLDGGTAAIGRDLAERFGLQPGAAVRIGNADLRVSGVIDQMPSAAGFALAPPVLVTRDGLAATGLLQPGSLYSSAYRLRLPDGADGQALGKAFQARFPDGGWRASDRGDAAQGMRRFTDRTAQLLLLIALGALGIGAIGISSAVAAFAASRRPTIAILKIHGASRRTLLLMLLGEVGLLGVGAIVGGLLLGALAPELVGRAAAGLLPVVPDPHPQWRALGLSALVGALATLAAAWAPLARAAGDPPATVLRGAVETATGRGHLLVPLVAGLGAVGIAVLQTSDHRFALEVVAAALFLALLFAGLGRLIARGARAVSHRGSPVARLGLAALHRPGAATVRLSVALGLGLALLIALAGTGASILAELRTTVPAKAPALFLLDIPAAGQQRFAGLAQRLLPSAELRLVPSLRGPVTAVNGTPVSQMHDIPEGAWILNGDRGLTFARTLPPGNRVVAGGWWPANYSGPPLISLDVAAATALKLKVGDTLTVSVLGRPIVARIASLREIDWRSLGFNFAIIFAPGTLEQAPYTMMATVAPGPHVSTLAFERQVASDFPMVSAIRVGDVVERVTAILTALEVAIRLATALAILIGIVVLAGAVAATRRERQREAVLLKLVGASRGQVLAAQLVEFATMSGVIALAAFGLGAFAAWLLVVKLFDFGFEPGWGELVLLPLAGVALAILVAMAAAWPALRARPAEALRSL